MDKTGGTEQGQDSQRIQSGQYIQDKKQSTRLPEQDSKKRTTRTYKGIGQTWQVSWQRTSETEHQDSTARTGQSGQVILTGHPGWVSLDRTART